MDFYIAKTIKNIGLEQAETIVTQKLKEQGFGVVTEIDIAKTLKNKIDVDFRPYKILGACNPKFAHEALSKVDKLGVMLPCNVCLQQSGETDIEVFAVNPLIAMESLNSSDVDSFGKAVYDRLNTVIGSL